MRGIIGTAGHIDHGKTALIRALTGEHTDRLPEERRRGISIDLGFTHLDTRHGVLGIIDVPGHEDFIRNMLAGATGVDVLLLVVAADEGVMPQTREHVAIAELLGVHQAVVALTKADLVDEDWLGLVHDDLADFLAPTPFAGAPVVATSIVAGTGIQEVRAALEDVFDGTRGQPDDLFRLPVDRTFTVQGTGTVVTGTVWSGHLGKDETVRVLPGGLEARVRGLQVHGGDVPAVEAGQRAAVALVGVDRADLGRGATLVAGPGWAETSRITATVRVLPSTGWEIERWQRLRLHLGTAEVMARAVPLDADSLAPGQHGLVQLRLESPAVARGGDRFVIRSYSPITTIGGGVVLEPLAPKRTRVVDHDAAVLTALARGDEQQAVETLLNRAGVVGVEVDTLPIAVGASPKEIQRALEALGVMRVRGRAFRAGTAEAVRDRLLDAVDDHHGRAPLQFGIDPETLRREIGDRGADLLVDAVLDQLLEEGSLTTNRGRIARRDFTPELSPDHLALRARIEAALVEAGVAAPRLDELEDQLQVGPVGEIMELLDAEGRVVRIEPDLYLERDSLDQAVQAIQDRLGGRTDLSPGDFREVLKISRRHLIPFLEFLDRTGITTRGAEGRAVKGQARA